MVVVGTGGATSCCRIVGGGSLLNVNNKRCNVMGVLCAGTNNGSLYQLSAEEDIRVARTGVNAYSIEI